MPEGVEVKLSADLIKPLVKDRLIISADTHPTSRYATTDPEGFHEFQKAFSDLSAPLYVENVSTKGKFMYWSFSNDWYLFCTFGMTGQWSPVAGKHPCIHIRHGQSQITDNKYIYFNDPRHFGTIKFVHGRQHLLDKLNELGWDPLQDQYSVYQKWIKADTMKSDKPIGQLLMNQSLFAGVGNYIRAEALYLARLSPWRAGKSLSEKDIDVLCKSICFVMEESYKHQGATIQTYKTAFGAEGKYSSCFKVYGQKLDPLGNKIIKEDTPDKRTIHWCPTIQI